MGSKTEFTASSNDEVVFCAESFKLAATKSSRAIVFCININFYLISV